MKIGNKDKAIYMNRIVMFNLLVGIFLILAGKFLFGIILIILTIIGRTIQNIKGLNK